MEQLREGYEVNMQTDLTDSNVLGHVRDMAKTQRKDVLVYFYS